ncbi:hypothetical protein [Escherichia coli]|uniref:hypothetical protein n=1 Tax=Escherichia coli TaxID=562 RepID=UPI00210875D0|nr:hypothetical protein [Escherichia coli]
MTTFTNSKLTDEHVSNATLIRLILWADQHNSHYVVAALRELQERRKADSVPVEINDDMAYAFHHALSDSSPGSVTAQPASVVPEAEPVAWTDEEELRDVRQYGFGEIFQCPPDKYADPRRVVPLYTAPPVPVVPEEISMSSSLPLMSDQLMVLGYVKGWNACREAMLKGKGGA